MIAPHATALYAALSALIFIWQTAQVVKGRRRVGAVMGDKGDKSLARAIRGHANASEQMPIFLIMLALGEMIGAPAIAVHLLGVAFVLGRLIHGLHFTDKLPDLKFRQLGMVLSLTSTGVLAIGLAAHALAGLL